MLRFDRIRPQLEQVYRSIIASVPPDVAAEDVNTLMAQPNVLVVVNPDWSWGRHSAIQKALETSASHVHYADMDRLLRWVETKPREWQHSVEVLQKTDCLIIGRTEEAFRTHPRAIQQTERIVNMVFSHLLGQPVDLCAGSKGFSRRAVKFLVASSPPGRALGTDAEWPMLLHRAGFAVDCLAVDGLDWESADRYRTQAADRDTQRRVAEAYDQDAGHWAFRVQVALEIVQAGLAARPQALVDGGHL
jgi:hypothetical protein